MLVISRRWSQERKLAVQWECSVCGAQQQGTEVMGRSWYHCVPRSARKGCHLPACISRQRCPSSGDHQSVCGIFAVGTKLSIVIALDVCAGKILKLHLLSKTNKDTGKRYIHGVHGFGKLMRDSRKSVVTVLGNLWSESPRPLKIMDPNPSFVEEGAE